MIQCLIIMRLEKRIIRKDVFLYNTYNKLYFLLVDFFYLINFSARSQVHTWLFAFSWEQRKLEECLSEITYGFTNPMSDTEDGPWKITAKDIVDGNINYSSARHTSQREYENLTKKSKPLVGDLLLTKDGTLGRTAIVNSENICINQSVALLRFNQKCSVQYVKTLLDTPRYQRQMLDDAGVNDLLVCPDFCYQKCP